MTTIKRSGPKISPKNTAFSFDVLSSRVVRCGVASRRRPISIDYSIRQDCADVEPDQEHCSRLTERGDHGRNLRRGLRRGECRGRLLGPAELPLLAAHLHRRESVRRRRASSRPGARPSARSRAAALLGTRNTLYGIQMAPLLQVRGLRRVVAAQITIDESTGVALSQAPRGVAGDARGLLDHRHRGLHLLEHLHAARRTRRQGARQSRVVGTRRRGAGRVPRTALAAPADELSCASSRSSSMAFAMLVTPLAAGRSADHRHDGRRGGLRMAGAVSSTRDVDRARRDERAVFLDSNCSVTSSRNAWLANARLQRINALIPISLLSALVVAQGVVVKTHVVIDHRLAGLAVALGGALGQGAVPRRRRGRGRDLSARLSPALSGRGVDYLPCQFGSRFSAKATAPSIASALRPIMPKASVLSCPGVLFGEFARLLHDVLGDPHGERRVLRDALGERDGLVENLLARHDAVHETEFVGALRVDGFGRQRHLVGDGEGDALGQSDQSAAAGDRDRAPLRGYRTWRGRPRPPCRN